MENTQIVKRSDSLEDFAKGQIILESLNEEDVITIIKGINEGERYWFQETKLMQDPIPNMGPRRNPTYSNRTFDEYGKEKLFEPFADFFLKAVIFFPSLTLYVHDGPFGFYPVFGIRHLNGEGNPYLIKFKQGHLSNEMYNKMVEILYSEKNIKKHREFNLEEIEDLDEYEY